MTMGPTVGNCPVAFALYFLCIGLCYPIFARDDLVVTLTDLDGEVGGTTNLTCTVMAGNAHIEWLFQEKPLLPTQDGRIIILSDEIPREPVVGNGTIANATAAGNGTAGNNTASTANTPVKNTTTSTITITNLTSSDDGNYTCMATVEDTNKSLSAFLNMSFPSKLVNQSEPNIKVMARDDITMWCIFEAYNTTQQVKWCMETEEGCTEPTNANTTTEQIDFKHIKSSYTLHSVKIQDNGTYHCGIDELATNGTIVIKVLAQPLLSINEVVGISKTQLYLSWNITQYNTEISAYHLSYRRSGEDFTFCHNDECRIDPKNTSFVIKGLEPDTEYQVQLTVLTYENLTRTIMSHGFVATLKEDPVFVPNISINGFSATSVTIGWVPPPKEIANFTHYYILEAWKKDEVNQTRIAYHSRDNRNLPYMFDSLEPHSTYVFRVRACSEYTSECGNWSQEMEAATLDGTPGKPVNVNATCSVSYLNLTWSPPEKRNAEIKGYTMEITGSSTFKDRYGNEKTATWGPFSKFTSNEPTSIRLNDLQPNTKYVIRLSAMTRTRRRGDPEIANCTTQPAAPDAPPRPKWRKIVENGTYMFKMYLPRISERNGPICCYRVYVVRMPPRVELQTLPLPSNIRVLDYEAAHAAAEAHGVGAYITDVFSNYNFPEDYELVIGDNKTWFNRSDPAFANPACSRCLYRPRREPTTTTSTSTSTTSTTSTTSAPDDDEAETGTDDPDTDLERKRRSYDDSAYSRNPMMMDLASDSHKDTRTFYDGPLDTNSNYTLFVELMTPLENELSVFSDYTTVLMAAASPPLVSPPSVLEIALQITCAVAAVILLLMIVFCIMQTRRSRKMPHHAHLEMNSLPAMLRHVMGGFFGRQQLVTISPPDQPPIAKEDLPKAYVERQGDSDYLFQKEFEMLQMLPEYFTDRTTHASEARENQPKNRYPDIKAYDQTRVKLSQIDGIAGSDYINANYVMGYQESKQFICAQGPTDTTVNDFWRMVWEHGLELVVMLTNLEEYSKVKCSQYWPDERGVRVFGNIAVQHVAEKQYSDYVVREMRITKHQTNSDGQPIIDNNGVAKRNGDIKDPESSAPTSPRELKESGESRLVRQYHFLMWKDFAAPEQPHSILKFIKRVNEAWSSMVGRPIVVHCSAGVGRTGTLVALDCLLQQLRATGHVAVFNTVAELRRQRNFLVQSLKQYVFVYRALVEYAHYGDTEISAGRLKPAVDRLRNTPEGADKCLMEIEFEKLCHSPIAEPLKSCAAGGADELRARNRSADCLPYDRNRVILAPLPGRDFSTYINASFIEAYDNTEGFIITQDPLPNTIMDFWRMVSEHNVTTIVMLSELGEGKCPRYWDDGTVQYEHISVQYEESESCPYYTRRQFTVTNAKAGGASGVRQLQYQGWPTAPGHVPEVTRGLAELADAAHAAHRATMLVHCQLGTERSPLFVALCTLITQLRVERRVDVSAVARAVRHQRARTIDTFLQYEFLYRAILNYAELHNLLEDS